MKVISSIYHNDFDGTPSNPTQLFSASMVMGLFRPNRYAIIEGALSVEHLLGKLISLYYFGKHHEKKEEFESHIIRSSFVTYSNKMSLVITIIKNEKLIDGENSNEKERNKKILVYEKLIRNVMHWRNAFTHGNLSITVGDEIEITPENPNPPEPTVTLSYYQNGPEKKPLTDEWLTEIEIGIKEAVSNTQILYSLLETRHEQKEKVSL